ncbi:hypothetical protein [Streptomyces sp. H39-S7]|uniref:hypothetical protein n=1 Tax=Streptomyces sp. H39-S7 TaxID=3004357 RepID=UPI0022AED98F|nr:hypothetical protein [Streptomyces sp. H39-S7]MCZ4125023.1 hypothetical protein [Streptomyces sp. H39-S7]
MHVATDDGDPCATRVIQVEGSELSNRQADRSSGIIAGTAAAVLAATVLLLPHAHATTDTPPSPVPATSPATVRVTPDLDQP